MASTLAADDAAAEGAMQALQGTMLLAAALPKDDVKPSDEAEGQMSKAGSQLYNSYKLLQSASQSFDAASERLNERSSANNQKSDTESAAGNIATGEKMLKQAEKDMREGNQLAQ